MEQLDVELKPAERRPGKPKGRTSLAALRSENEELKRRLDEVVATASSNEIIWRHFAEIEKILFRTRELDQLVHELLVEVKTRFQPDQVILFLCHPEVLERFFPEISEDSEPIGEGTWILPVPVEMGNSICCGDSTKPVLLSSDGIKSLLPFLPEAVSPIQSGVLIPLRIHQIPFGGLFLGSLDPDHYRPKDSTDLLEQLGIKIVLCMDNCLTYERVKDFAVRDPLTGLLNFFQVHTTLEREFRKTRRLGKPLSVLMIDLDFYHEVDAQVDMGNEVLKHVADHLKEILPEGESVLGRYGSDEFLVLLPNVPEEEAREVVPYLSQRIRKSPFKHENTAILIQTIIGVGTLKDDMKRPQDLLDAAYTELCRLKMHHEPAK